ncbi:unnamed protein product [Cylicostephanus goldi]|uniref:Choline/ethanolamine kinase n=1 Tax=Cylicostephanus goldi TaxID=71465 RepID=A0A3P7MTK9_CYLGO|nr:unnamed protein product [Cylicostephanus goldi]
MDILVFLFQSRPLTCREIALPTMSSKIAKRLSKVHQLEVPIWKEPDYLCDALNRWLCQLMGTPHGENTITLPSRYSQWAPAQLTCDYIARELDYLRTMISKSKSPVTFCHNDLQEDYDVHEPPYYKIYPENFPEEHQVSDIL